MLIKFMLELKQVIISLQFGEVIILMLDQLDQLKWKMLSPLKFPLISGNTLLRKTQQDNRKCFDLAHGQKHNSDVSSSRRDERIFSQVMQFLGSTACVPYTPAKILPCTPTHSTHQQHKETTKF